MLLKKGLKFATTLYEKETKKIKNKRIRNALQSDLVNVVVDQGTGLLSEKITW